MHAAVDLGRQHDRVPLGKVPQGPADELFAGAVGIDVGRVEEIDARFQCLLDVRAALLLGKAPRVRPALGDAVAHAAEAQSRDFQAGFSQIHVLH